MAGMSIGLRAEQKLAEVTELLASKGVTFEPPEIVFDLKGHNAGWAVGGKLIRLNLAVIGDPRYTEDMFEQTLPHEIAHIVVQQLWPGSQPHGEKWAEIMSLLGLPATRCHQYKTKSSRKGTLYAYTCNCMTHTVSATLHRRICGGTEYRCSKCKGLLR